MDGQPDYLVVRQNTYTRKEIPLIDGHNERLKSTYTNEDIDPSRSTKNVHFKTCPGRYIEVFDQMEKAGVFSLRGLRGDAILLDELVIDVNSDYFRRHGYEYTLAFFKAVYDHCAELAGGEQYILSAVLHADERNAALSEKYGHDVWHYHLHVVYVPVVAKEIKYSKRCKDKALVGTVRETVMQVSHSKKWASAPLRDDHGEILRNDKGQVQYDYSYSKLQSDFFSHMQTCGFLDLTRGVVGSIRKHKETVAFKLEQDSMRARELRAEVDKRHADLVVAQRVLERMDETLTQTREDMETELESLSEIQNVNEYLNTSDQCNNLLNHVLVPLQDFANRDGILRDRAAEYSLISTVRDLLLQFLEALRQLLGFEAREQVAPEACETVKIMDVLEHQIVAARIANANQCQREPGRSQRNSKTRN